METRGTMDETENRLMKASETVMRIMIAGGGTGGHVYPGIAIYEALRRRRGDVDVLFVGARGGVEARIFDELGLPNVLIAGRGIRGTSFLSKVTSPFVFAWALGRAMKEVLVFRPQIVIGTGGYASVAVMTASLICGRKRVIQEQNSVPGMANRLLSRFAHLILLSYTESLPFFGNKSRCAVVGNPLRIPRDVDRSEALRFLDLDGDLPVVLIFGGSRGAQAINLSAVDAIRRILASRRVQFVLLTGERDFERIRRELEGVADMVRVLPFLHEIHYAYRVADMAISRAGASAVFELAAFGIPTVFVPYPYAADDHQTKNVGPLEQLEAAVVIENDRLCGEVLETIILSLLGDDTRRREMASRMKGWSDANADQLAAEKILDLSAANRLTIRTLWTLECRMEAW